MVNNLQSRLVNYVRNIISSKERDLANISKNLIHPKSIIQQNEKKLQSLQNSIDLLIKNQLQHKEHDVKLLEARLIKPDILLNNLSDKISFLFEDSKKTYLNELNKMHSKVLLASKLLDSYHYKKVLKRGYAIVRDESDNIICDITETAKDQKINIEMNSGKVKATIS